MADDLHAKLDAALVALPKPVTLAQVLQTARSNLPPAEYTQFAKWTGQNGPTLLGRLNG